MATALDDLMNPLSGGIVGLLLNDDYRSEILGLIVERMLPIALGVIVFLIGVAFVLSETKAASVVTGAATKLVTKGVV